MRKSKENYNPSLKNSDWTKTVLFVLMLYIRFWIKIESVWTSCALRKQRRSK